MTSKEIMISRDRSRGCSGSIQISGAKNASLPLMAACLLTDEEVVLQNVPKISDIDLMKKQLESYGVQVNDRGSRRELHATRQTRFSPANNDGSKTRGSFLVLGPLLARFGRAKVHKPGGCQIGQNGRPVNYHTDALQLMGATIEQDSECVSLSASGGLRRARVHFPQISVGATETVIMAACLADGQTVITNAAVEPEIIDLVKMLNAMGGNITVNESGKKIVINGRSDRLLNGCTHTVIPDRIEAGTWAIAAAITGGSLLLKMDPEIGRKIMVPTFQMLQQAGVHVQWKRDGLERGLEVQRSGQINPVDITTGPFPQFPTDLLPLWVTFMTQANGPSILTDTIYDNRFKHVTHLQEMGARITEISNREYRVHGNASLTAERVEATDLRAGAALVLAALVANGSTKIKEFQHVLRGYEDIRGKLLECWSATIEDVPGAREGFDGGILNALWENLPCVLL